MKRAIAIAAITALLATSAFASAPKKKPPADPPPPPAPVYSWTGWYIGGNVGSGWTDNSKIANTATPAFCNGAFVACLAGPPFFNTSLAAAVPPNFDPGRRPGVIGGGQIGYNYQFATWVAGIEADFQSYNIGGSASAIGLEPTLPTTVTGAGTRKIDYLGTVRGRVGWLPGNSVLVYATGGLAYGRVQTDVSFAAVAVAPPCFTSGVCGATSTSQSNMRTGWTVGGGLEWKLMFAPQWSVKAEYLYYDLGHVTLNSTLPIFFGPLVATANIASDAHYNGNILRVGVNYHF